MTERDVVKEIALHMQRNYPDAVYRFDLAADLKLTIGQAKRHKALHPHRGYPDFFLAEPRGIWKGLYLELKKDGVTIVLKDGTITKDPHIREQAQMLERLFKKGYGASFAVGITQAKTFIDRYMSKNGAVISPVSIFAKAKTDAKEADELPF
jgi:hypothetical protein